MKNFLTARIPTPDFGLLYLRLTAGALLIYVHGLPKLLNFSAELQHIDDPLHVGHAFTLGFALFAEIVCPIAIAVGCFTRLASIPVLVLLFVSMLLVHPDWSIAEGQFGWLLIIAFGTIVLAGPGRYALDQRLVWSL